MESFKTQHHPDMCVTASRGDLSKAQCMLWNINLQYVLWPTGLLNKCSGYFSVCSQPSNVLFLCTVTKLCSKLFNQYFPLEFLLPDLELFSRFDIQYKLQESSPDVQRKSRRRIQYISNAYAMKSQKATVASRYLICHLTAAPQCSSPNSEHPKKDPDILLLLLQRTVGSSPYARVSSRAITSA